MLENGENGVNGQFALQNIHGEQRFDIVSVTLLRLVMEEDFVKEQPLRPGNVEDQSSVRGTISLGTERT